MSKISKAINLFYQEKDVIKILKSLILCCLLLFFYQISFAQNFQQQKSLSEGSLLLSGELSLDSLTKYVHIHTGVRFSFNSGKIKPSKKIFFPQKKYAVFEVLKHIKKTTSLYYIFTRGYVIFQDKPIQKSKDQNLAGANTKPVSKKTKSQKNRPDFSGKSVHHYVVSKKKNYK